MIRKEEEVYWLPVSEFLRKEKKNVCKATYQCDWRHSSFEKKLPFHFYLKQQVQQNTVQIIILKER